MYKLVPAKEIPLARTVNINNREEYAEIGNFILSYVKTTGLAGLHAVQLGIPKDIFVVGNSIYLNCEYASLGHGTINSIEGCASIPGELYKVERFKTIRVMGYEFCPTRKRIRAARDLPHDVFVVDEIFYHDEPRIEDTPPRCIVFQHEIDHKRGILISHHGLKLDGNV